MTEQKPEPCPTCGTLCNISWAGLDLVENTGDETLATKCYTPDGGLEEIQAEEISTLQKQLEEANRIIVELRKQSDQFYDYHYDPSVSSKHISYEEGQKGIDENKDKNQNQ